MIRKTNKLSSQVKRRLKNQKNKKQKGLWTPPKGTNKFLLSTGSTLVDLAITGRRFIGGGIPMGILVEIFGASSKGKTVMLLEMAGNVQRMDGDYMFLDPEARVSKDFARIFGFEMNEDKYKKPNTVEDAFTLIKKWNPKGKGPFVVFIDSIAALVSKEENEDKGDEYSGARRARDFSQQLRQITRIIAQKEYLIICTNQIRQNLGAGPYGKKTKPTGGEAPKFYSSLRLELKAPPSEGIIKMEKSIKGVKQKRNIGVQTNIYVEKSTISTPYQTGLMRILFDYGIDSITTDLKFLKKNTGSSSFILNDEKIGSRINDAVEYIEKNGLENELKEEVIDLWTKIQKALTPDRKRKIR